MADEPGSVCTWEGPGGVKDMKARLPMARLKLFKGSSHSIHNSNRAEFIQALRMVVHVSQAEIEKRAKLAKR